MPWEARVELHRGLNNSYRKVFFFFLKFWGGGVQELAGKVGALCLGFSYALTLSPTLVPHGSLQALLGRPVVVGLHQDLCGGLLSCFLLAFLLACLGGRPLPFVPPFSRPPASHRIIFLGSVEVTGTFPFQMEGTFSRGRDLIHFSVWGLFCRVSMASGKFPILRPGCDSRVGSCA